jgi:ribosome-binding protein aMBF1 (putative translation factor)
MKRSELGNQIIPHQRKVVDMTSIETAKWGDKLRNYRIASGLSQEKLSKAMGAKSNDGSRIRGINDVT